MADGRRHAATRVHTAIARASRPPVPSSPRLVSLDITTLTLYAFSADNWRRPQPEVTSLMRMFRRYLVEECQSCIDNGIRLEVIGRRDRLGQPLRRRHPVRPSGRP